MNKLFWQNSNNNDIIYAIREINSAEHVFDIFTNYEDYLNKKGLRGFNLYYNQQSMGLYKKLHKAKQAAQNKVNELELAANSNFN